jgi:hypothetical protein
MLLVTGMKLNLPLFWCLAITSGGAYYNQTSLTAPVITRKRRKFVQVKCANCNSVSAQNTSGLADI